MKPLQPFNLRQLAVNFGALLSGAALARILAGLSLILIARQVGPAQFGQLTGSLALTKIAAVFFVLGIEGWLLRNGYREGSRQILARKGTSSLAIVGGLGSIWLLTVALVAGFLNQEAFPFPIMLLCAVAVWLEEIANIGATVFKAALRNRVTLILMTGSQLLLIGLIVIQAGMAQTALLPYLASRTLGLGIAALATLYWLRREFGFDLVRADIRQTLRELPPYALSLGLALIYERADVVIVNSWLGQEQAGYYAPAITIVSALNLIAASFFAVLVPTLSRIHVAEPDRLPALVRWLLISSGVAACLFGGALALSAHFLIDLLYGLDYQPAGDVLMILSGVLALRAVTFVAGAVLLAVGWQTRRLTPQALAAGLNVALNLLVVQRFGIQAVALVYVFTEAILLAGYLWLVLRWQHQTIVKHSLLSSGKSDSDGWITR